MEIYIPFDFHGDALLRHNVASRSDRLSADAKQAIQCYYISILSLKTQLVAFSQKKSGDQDLASILQLLQICFILKTLSLIKGLTTWRARP